MSDDSATSRGLGGRIAGKIAQHLVGATVATRAQTAPLQRQVGAIILDDFFQLTGSELRATMGATFRQLAEHPTTDDSMRPLMQFLAKGNGQMASFIGGSITGSVISGGLGDLITNTLAPTIHAIIANQPHGILTPADIAAADVRGFRIGQDHAYEAAQGGLNGDRYEALRQLQIRRPEVGQLLDALNRGDITDGEARGGLLQLGFREGDLDSIISGRRQILSPQALADLVVFGVLTEERAWPLAKLNGITREDFAMLVLGAGQPPSNEELAFALRRGVIDRDRYVKGLMQGPLRNEWIPYVEQMVLSPMSVADAVESVVQGALTDAQGRAIATQDGLIPEHWAPLVAIAGNPPGVQELGSMYRRRIITHDQLVQGIKESRLKNKYIEATIASTERLPPERSIISLVSKSHLTDAQGMDLLLKLGYSAGVSAAFLAEAHTTKTQPQRELTASQIIALYEDGAINRDDTLSMLDSLGYDAEVATWEVTIADLRVVKKFNDAAISRLHSLYVGWRITEQETLTTLDSLRIAPGERDNLMTLWNLERDVSTKDLTLAQITAAHKRGLIDDQGFYDRVRGIGYATADAVLLAELQAIDPTGLTVS